VCNWAAHKGCSAARPRWAADDAVCPPIWRPTTDPPPLEHTCAHPSAAVARRK